MSSSLVFVIVLFSATPQSNPSPSPTPLPQVTDVTLTRTAQDLSPAIRVSWSAVSGSGITYTVCYSEHPNDGTTADPPADAKCDTSDTDTSTILSPLSPGTLHYIWVAALSSGRRGPFSSRRGVGTYRVPSAVGRLSITQAAVSGQLALTVSWNKPQSDATITRYDVEYKVSNTGRWTTKSVTGANTLSTTLTNLEGGRSYDIRLRAVSPVGGGGYSPVQTQKAGNVPSLVGRPTVTQTAVSGRPALAVSWRAPQSDLAITGYDVQYRRSDSNNWDPNDVMRSTLLAVTLTSLTAGRSYDVRVRAVSAVGAGAYGPHQTQRLSTVPSAVGTPSVTRVVVSGRPALRVSWTKPSSELAITRYDVQYRQSGTIAWSTVVVSGSNTVTTTLTTLVASRSYDVQVRAVSAAGTGAFSRTQSPVVGRVPSQVTGLSVTQTAVSGRPALRVSWSRPQSDATITRYEVQYRVSISGSWATVRVTGANTLTTTLITFTAGRSYDVRVRAVSSVGNGAYSNVQTRYLNRVPSTVGTPTVMPTVASSRPALRVSWSAPESDLTITRFDIQYRVSNSRDWRMVSETGSGTVSRLLTRLEVGTSYDVQVRAVSTAGNGAYSSVVRQPTYGAPEAVTDVQFTVSENGNNVMLTVTWSRPSSDVDIVHYKVQYQQGSAPMTTIEVEGLQTTITTMKGKTYQLRVRAVSDIAEGPWSKYITIEPPTTATGVMITSSSTTLSLTWNEEGFSYRLYVQKRDSAVTSIPGPLSPPYNITGLESNTQYTVVVEAYNPLGSKNATRTVWTLSEAVKDLNLQVLSSTAIKVSWTPPPNADHLPLTYHVSYSSEFTSSTSKSTTEQSLDLTGLHPFDVYTITVEAQNPRGRSGNVVLTAQTMSAAPSVSPVNDNPSSNTINSRSITIKWRIPPRGGRNGIITQYIVRWFVAINSQYRILRNITVSVESPTFNSPSVLTHTVTGLTPYTPYGWQVAAVNDAGIGVFSTRFGTITKQDVPGPVSSLNYTITSDTEATITWGVPEEPNGVVTGYDVVYGVYMRNEGQKSQSTASSRTRLDITGLAIETPIHVSVRARTSVGPSEHSTITFFTKEGVPTDKPKNVKVDFINDTHVNVFWDPLSLHEARGWPSYTVFMKGGMGSCASILQSKPTGASSIVMGDLDPASSYSVTVQVQTSAGTSDALKSEPVILEKRTSPIPSSNGDSGLSVGLFIAGMVSGVLALLLVEGIIWGACKMSKSSHKKSRKNVDLGVTAVEMTDCPAYESVDRMYEDMDKIGNAPKQTDAATVDSKVSQRKIQAN